MSSVLRVQVVGATGYGGAELVRLLSGHPNAEVVSVTSSRAAGEPLSRHCPWLSTDLVLSSFDPSTTNADVVFLAQEHGFAMKVAPELIRRGIKVVDLSADFRLLSAEQFRKYYHSDTDFNADGTHFRYEQYKLRYLYGLPEIIDKSRYESAMLVANPGCYPTATLLALKPLFDSGIVSGVPVVDGKSGVSGAGRAKNGSEFLFSERANSMKSYAITGHRHTPEIAQFLGVPVRFTPHLIPIPRGMEVTTYVPLSQPISQEELTQRMKTLYASSHFVRVVDDLPETKQVLGSNRCDLSYRIDPETNFVVTTSVIDNLGKGAAGQAIQNMNLLFGLDEALGLPIHGVWP
jgi:N-acetyl-gamma-glutamyl-phosphate reductase